MNVKLSAKALNLHRIPLLPKLYKSFLDMKLPAEDVILPSNGMEILVRNPRSSSIARSIFFTGVWEPEVTQFISRKIKPGMNILDIGADVGYYTLLFAKLAGENGRVFAFEPIPTAKDYLEQNLEINKLSNVEVFEFALFDEAGIVCLEDPFIKSNINPAKQTLSEKDIRVEMKVFDDWKAEQRIDKVDLVKLDVEGAELNILRGMKKTLQSLRPAILVEVHPEKLPTFGFSAADFMDFILDLGYQIEPVDKTTINLSQGNITLFCQ